MANNTTLSKEQILNRLEKSSPEQLEARLEMKGASGSRSWIVNVFRGVADYYGWL